MKPELQELVKSLVEQAARDEIVALIYRNPRLAEIPAEDLALVFTAGAKAGCLALDRAWEMTDS